MGYRIVRALTLLLLRVFYRRIEVVNAERIPARGPLVIAANHHNALVDPMLIMAIVPRPVTSLAKAPLFRHPLIAPFLRLAGAVPVNRRAEGGDDPRRNDAMFAAAAARLRAGGALVIFPEGRSQAQPTLLPLRTGAARILVAAEAGDGRPDATLLPVGLVFGEPGTFRDASALVSIGSPVVVDDCIASYAAAPEASVRTITDRLAAAIREQIVEADDQYTLELLGALEDAWREERGSPGDSRAALAWKQDVMRAAAQLARSRPERLLDFRRRLESYRTRLRETGLSDAQIGQPYTAGLVARYVVENLVALVLTFPLAVWGMICHAAPYLLTGRVVRWLGREPDEEATDKIAAGAVLYPIFWLMEGWLILALLGTWPLLVFIVLLVPSGLLALAWRERLQRVGRQARAFARFILNRRLHDELCAERRALLGELAELAELAGRA